MTEHSPNTEIVLSSDLFDDDPCLESMSVPTLAILNAYLTGYGWLDSPTKKDCRGLAAALRAAADEVLPSPRLPFDSCCEIRSAGERVELLAIAAELEGQ